MGMLFNTEATTKMVSLINRHFSSDFSGGAIEAWRDRIDDIDPTKGGRLALPKLAKEYEVHPNPEEDKLGKTKSRWIKWLRHFENATQQTEIKDPAKGDFPSGAIPAGWLPAPAKPTADPATWINAGKEWGRQVSNGLRDPSCVEITFAIVPSSAISIGSPQIVKTVKPPPSFPANPYSLVVTIYTKRVDELP